MLNVFWSCLILACACQGEAAFESTPLMFKATSSTRAFAEATVSGALNCDFATSTDEEALKTARKARKPLLLRRSDSRPLWLNATGWTRDAVASRLGDRIASFNNGRFDAHRTTSWAPYVDFANMDATQHNENNHIFEVGPRGVHSQLENLRGLPRALQMIIGRPLLSIGDVGTYTHFHKHDETWLWLAHGAKVWFLAEPSEAIGEFVDHATHPCDWLYETKRHPNVSLCVQNVGDFLYFPSNYWHATCNIADWTVGIGAQENVRKWPPANVASIKNDMDALNESLQKSSNLRRDASLAFTASLPFGHLAVTERLREYGADGVGSLQYGRDNPVTSVVQPGHHTILEYLLRTCSDNERTAQVQGADRSRWTNLHWASMYGHYSVTKLLLDNRADISATVANVRTSSSDRDWTPLHLAARSGSIPVAELLVKRRADLNQKDSFGWNPLHAAVRAGHVRFLAWTASTDRQALTALGPNGSSVWHVAASAGHPHVVRALHSLWPSGGEIPDEFGRLPSHSAAAAGHQSVAAQLRALAVEL
eukprot:TRINITY_DN23790_c0_g1_i1.p1 TRINITY_DN23790_c0_g1~~TRINITY_DN23790_c0_g1_i1.p1  ORF type:complete len:537 (+),score=50.93 TRINITY_DN23790_c0_g1_i1:45-1655(+)